MDTYWRQTSYNGFSENLYITLMHNEIGLVCDLKHRERRKEPFVKKSDNHKKL